MAKAEEIIKEAKTVFKAIETFGDDKQTIVAIEELSELIKELTKALRGELNKDHLTEELADVDLMLMQIMFIYRIDQKELDSYKKRKVDRLAKNLEELEETDG